MRNAKKVLAFCMAVMMTLSTVLLYAPAKKAYAASAVSVSETGGWLESAYVKWAEVSGATAYRVYVKGASAADSAYVQLDDELIRKYPTYWRADALGLKAGSYVLKVEAVTADGTVNAVTDAITVIAHDRSGYAFDGGTASGAYNDDGTLKSNAIVVYVTNDNKDTVTVALNTEGKGNVDCKGVQNIILGYKKGKETRPMAIRFIGNITDLAVLTKGDLYLDAVKAGMTLEGVGDDATINGFGIVLKGCTNVEVRNLGLMNCNSEEGDDIGLQQDDSYCWIHNCDFFYGDAGKDSDQAKGDGALDTKKSNHITHSYNHFWDNGKCNLQGANGDTSNYITYHHNWYDHSDSRHPRVRVATVHVYNNYYDGNAKYGIGSTTGSSVFSENNYFRNCKLPMLTAMQGSDNVYAENPSKGIFSAENGGVIKAYGNYMEGQTAFVSYQENNVEYDAYVASSRNETVPSTVTAKKGGATYNNFDTASNFYKYEVQSAKDAKDTVVKYAGRVNGGDFKWQFDNSVDDTDANVNVALKKALTGYESSLVSVGGDAQAAAVTKYTVSVTSGSASATKAPEGTEITITANTISGKTFSGWSVTAGGVTLTDAKAATTTFKMPAANVAITANYTADGSGDNGGGSGDNGGGSGSGSGSITEGGYLHNFTTSGTDSSFYTISGNLSTKNGTVNYGGLTLTRCLKLETATNIAFTAPSKGTLTLVFVELSKERAIKIDGKACASDANGVLETVLEAGSHTLTKGDTANLFLINFVPEGSGSGSGDNGGGSGSGSGDNGGGSGSGSSTGEVTYGDYAAVTIPEDGLVTTKIYGKEDEVKFTVLDDMPKKPETESGLGYECYYQQPTNNPTLSGTIPTGGAAFKVEAVKNVKVKFVIRNVGKTTDSAKTYYVADSDGKTLSSADMGSGEIKTVPIEFEAEAGKTYYVYVKSSKIMVYEFGYAVESGTDTPGEEEKKEGLVSGEDGVFKYYENNEWISDKYAYVDFKGERFLVAHGKVAGDMNGLAQDPEHPADWYYVAEGRIVKEYSGLAIYEEEWFNVVDGRLDTTFAGYVDYNGGKFYVGAGRIMREVNGLAKDPNSNDWYYLAKGEAQIQYTGLAEYDEEWFYVINGKLAEEYTGEIEYDGAVFWVVNGMLKDKE